MPRILQTLFSGHDVAPEIKVKTNSVQLLVTGFILILITAT